MMTGSRVQAKQFLAAMRGGKDNGDGTSGGQPTTQPGQLLKAMVLKNAGKAASAPGQNRSYEDAAGGSYKATAYPQRIARPSVAAMSRAPARRRAATARQILKSSTRK